MEQVPYDSAHDRSMRLTDMARYCRMCAEAKGDLLQTRFAVADFVNRQFHLDYTDAGQLLDSFGLFDENDSEQAIYEKASLAPLFVMETYVELMTSVELSTDDNLWSDQLADWYSDMATMARGMVQGADDASPSALHALRSFLLAPALQEDLSRLATEADKTRHHIIVDAKLSAAVDCELLSEAQKEALDSEYLVRVAQQETSNE